MKQECHDPATKDFLTFGKIMTFHTLNTFIQSNMAHTKYIVHEKAPNAVQ